MRNFIDSIFGVPEDLLNFIIQKLNGISGIVGKGIRLSDYFGWFGMLGSEWVAVINSLLASFSVLAILWISQKVYRLYLAFKEGVKWW
jgi:hypothetical protein